MTHSFVTDIVETKVVKKVNFAKDVYFYNGANISLVKSGTTVELVIGAHYDNRVACHFGKKSLLTLAETLKEVAETLSDTE